METGIFYALIAGLFWGSSPVLVKRGLVGSDVSAATLYQQATILLTLVLAAVLEGNLMAQRIAPLPLAVFIATGIVGATVMPHAIYLHSALTQGRVVVNEPGQLRRLFRYELVAQACNLGTTVTA